MNEYLVLEDWYEYLASVGLEGKEAVVGTKTVKASESGTVIHAKIGAVFVPTENAQFVQAQTWVTDESEQNPVAVKNLSVALHIGGKSVVQHSIPLGGMVVTGVIRLNAVKPKLAQAHGECEIPRLSVTAEAAFTEI
ncbi:MAG TPA: hypothetical protein VFC29_00985 [Candidatus Limnocylindrales bacterium]|nr:hypothetical protein [Candidatus Limnocylindrales bacterium]